MEFSYTREAYPRAPLWGESPHAIGFGPDPDIEAVDGTGRCTGCTRRTHVYNYTYRAWVCGPECNARLKRLDAILDLGRVN